VTTALCGDGQSERSCRVGGAGAVWSARARRPRDREAARTAQVETRGLTYYSCSWAGRPAGGPGLTSPKPSWIMIVWRLRKDAAVAGSQVPLDVGIEDAHEYGGGVAVKPDGDLIGVHPRQRVPRQCSTATNTPSPYAPNPPSEPRRQAGRCLDHRSRESRE
jgi:hypothetical protein